MNKMIALEQICKRYGVTTMYVFGSRAQEIFAGLHDKETSSPANQSDVDIGITAKNPLPIKEKAALTIALEDFFGVGQVDLVIIPEADPFLAANIIRGERLYADNDYLADEYDLYILRRAGDLIPLEQERQQLIMENLK